MKAQVYGLWPPGFTEPDLRQCRYIGCTITRLKHRLGLMIFRAKSGRHKRRRVYIWLREHVLPLDLNPEMHVLETVSEAKAAEAEQRWIVKVRAIKQPGDPELLNMKVGGGRGRRMPENVRREMANLYQSGLRQCDVARRCKTTERTVMRACHEFGVPIRRGADAVRVPA